MKKLYKFLAIGLSAIVAFGAAACGNKNGTEEQKTAETQITETDNYLVKDGKSDYIIVYPKETQTNMINVSLSELTLFFEQATGVVLTAKSDADEDLFWSKSAKYISLGETEILTASGVAKDDDRAALKLTGYTIKNAGDSVFLVGGGENGVLNAVYRFLREEFHFECYAADEIALDKNVKERKLLNFNGYTEVPDIMFHAAAQNETMLNQIYSRRLGMVQLSDWIIELGGAFCHNVLLTIPKATYQAEHANWFSPSGTQLCFTRDREGLAHEFLKKIIEVLEKNPGGYALPITQMDDGGWCDCPECQACAVKYGADSASQILFMNYLWDILEDWLKVNMPEREVYLYMFAYQSNTEPPKEDENGNIPEEMILRDNIYVQYAPIYAAGYQSYDYKNPEASDNSSFDNMFKGWQKITNHIMAWTYSFYYKGTTGMYPYFDFSDMKETFTYLANNGVDYLFDEDHSGSARVWSDFSRLKLYLRSKLAWDTNADLMKYTDAFFANYYKSASTTMRQLFDEYSSHFAMLIAENNLRGQGGVLDINEQKFWPKGLLDRWMRMFDKAFSDIEYLKESDPALYDTLERRIRLDSISLRYLCETLYGADTNVYVGNGNSIIDDLHDFGISYLG